MNGVLDRFRKTILFMCATLTLFGFVTGCGLAPSGKVQGYVEGEFVYIASPLAGTLNTLNVQRGDEVDAGAPLFSLEDTSERAALEEAQRRLAQAKANLNDLRKGRRPSEIAALEAQLKQARAALAFSAKELARQEQLLAAGVGSQQNLDRAAAARDGDRERVAQLEAEIRTAELGSRVDQILAAQAGEQALEAAVVQAKWALSQKAQNAPQAGLIFDTLYREGEWVAAGRPVISLLPPQNIKVKAFVPEKQLSAIHLGSSVYVSVDGMNETLKGKVNFISPRAEYTPPVIYSLENRSKLVFMIEAVFDPETAKKLHPGQPVDIQFES